MRGYVRHAAIAMVCMVVAACSLVPSAHASNKDLTIAPLRSERTVSAGEKTTGRFTLTNETDKPLDINLSVQQFTVKNYSYDYVFRSPDKKWLSFADDHVQLQPKSSKAIDYTITVPTNAASGGYYFSMIGGTTVKGSGLPITVQLGSLLYLTVSGSVTKSAQLERADIAFLQTGRDIPYTFDVHGTGNTHFVADFFAQLGGSDKIVDTHFLLPDTVRQIKGSLRAPLWPGIYSVTYGYQADYTASPVTKTAQILYLPLWFIALVSMIIFGGGMLLRRRRLARKS